MFLWKYETESKSIHKKEKNENDSERHSELYKTKIYSLTSAYWN